MEIFSFFGRLHPLVLHLPIGFLVLAFIMEWASRKERLSNLSPAVGFAILLGMWSAIFAAISGYILSLEGGYEETLLSRHQWLGIATAMVGVVVYFFYKKRNSKAGKKLYFPLFGVLMLLLGITGHVGGSLTHGSDFLTAPFSKKMAKKKTITNIDEVYVFADLIQPIFKEKCNRCHNESKLKGELLMSTIEGIKKGGETGAFFQAGDVANSLFLQRIHLPIEEEEHMPPKGKKQLTEDEIALLEWWIKEGATFEKKAGAVNQSENIKPVLAKYVTAENNIFALNVASPDEDDLNDLQVLGIPVERLSEKTPFVTIDLRGRKDLDKNTFSQLRKVSKQLVELNLSDTNMNDELLFNLTKFPHLQKIFLEKTKVTGANLEALHELEYLEYLNLYDTPLTDAAVAKLEKMPSLKNVFLWKTNASQKAIQALISTRPKLNINTGISSDIFGIGKLKEPGVKFENDIFQDSLLIEFEMSFKGANIFYTLDGTTPDSVSQKYSAPFYISKSATIQAITHKEGWETSPINSKSVVRAKYQPTKVQLNKKPNEKYAAAGGKSLADLKKGTTDFGAGEWLGFQKEHFTAIIDLGKMEDVSRVTVSALESTGAWIFFPKGVKASISKNGQQYTSVASKEIPTTSEAEPASTKNFVLEFENQNARYLKIEVKSNLVNPPWHPAPGEPCWVFVDEILVE